MPPRRCAVSAVLAAIIAAYKEVFRGASLTDALLFSNYAIVVLVVDEVCREVGVESPAVSRS